MKSLLICGGHIIDPARGIDVTGSLLITDGKISWMGDGEANPPRQEYNVLPARGLIICPGFIDLHCHLREPGFEEKETIATGTLAAARGGFTTVCCMPNTNPPLDNRTTIEYVKAKAEIEAPVRVLPVGCISKDRKGQELADMTNMASAGVIGFSDDGDSVLNPELMRQALVQSSALGLPVIEHCEDPTLVAGGVVNQGAVSTKLGLKGIPASAEDNMVARDLALAEQTGARLHITHVSTAGSVDLIRHAKENGVRVTTDVTPHHLTLTEECVIESGTIAKVNPPLRTRCDIQALIQGLKDNIINIIATDHAPHTKVDKQLDFTKAPSGISGFETALGSLMSLVHSGQLTLPELIALLTFQPARIIGGRYGKIGTLAIGAPADVTIFDPGKEWLVDTSTFASKGKNTPFDGRVLRGKVMVTISRGNTVYVDDSVQFIKT